MLRRVHSLYIHPALSPRTLPRRCRSLLGGPHPFTRIWVLQTWCTFPSDTRTTEMHASRPGRSLRSQPAVCCIFLLLKEVAGPHPGTNLVMSQGTKFAKEKIQLFNSVL